MQRDGVNIFLAKLGAENVTDGGDWIRCSCPLAPYRHPKGTDSRPSFGIKVNDVGASGWYCFTCDMGGSLLRLVHALWWLSEEYPEEAASAIWDHEFWDNGIESLIRGMKVHPRMLVKDDITYGPVPQPILDKYPLIPRGSEVWDWLVDVRRISPKAIRDFKLRKFIDDQGRLGVIFPKIARDGETVKDMHVRMIGEKIFFRLNERMTQSPIPYHAKELLFGNHLIFRERPLWLFEAPLDAMRLYSLGVTNVGATCGPPNSHQLLNIYAPMGVIAAFDSDTSGERFKARVKQELSTPVVYTVEWSQLVGADGKPKKDGNEVDDIEQVKEVLRKRRVFVSPL